MSGLTELRAKVILCAIRTVGVVALVGIMWWGARAIGWSYDDTRVVLGLLNGYFPEIVALSLFAGVAVVVYKATVADDTFNFIHFFISDPRHHEDIGKFVFFLMAVTSIWVVFTLAWRDKLTEAMLGVILAAFVIERLGAIGGKALGKAKVEQPTGEAKP